jgi:hypothetical protein
MTRGKGTMRSEVVLLSLSFSVVSAVCCRCTGLSLVSSMPAVLPPRPEGQSCLCKMEEQAQTATDKPVMYRKGDVLRNRLESEETAKSDRYLPSSFPLKLCNQASSAYALLTASSRSSALPSSPVGPSPSPVEAKSRKLRCFSQSRWRTRSSNSSRSRLSSWTTCSPLSTHWASRRSERRRRTSSSSLRLVEAEGGKDERENRSVQGEG